MWLLETLNGVKERYKIEFGMELLGAINALTWYTHHGTFKVGHLSLCSLRRDMSVEIIIDMPLNGF